MYLCCKIILYYTYLLNFILVLVVYNALHVYKQLKISNNRNNKNFTKNLIYILMKKSIITIGLEIISNRISVF